MARVKKESKQAKLWFEDKIALARKLLKPQAARATARWGAPAGAALLVFFTLYSLFAPKDQFQLAKERLVKDPKDFAAYLILAEEFLKNNQFKEAERMLLLAQKIKKQNRQKIGELKDSFVLGTTSSKLKHLWQKKHHSDPEDIKKLIAAWEKIVSKKPNYRDGYLQLAILHYKLFHNSKAKEYLEKTLRLDPNFAPAKKLEKTLQ